MARMLLSNEEGVSCAECENLRHPAVIASGIYMYFRTALSRVARAPLRLHSLPARSDEESSAAAHCSRCHFVALCKLTRCQSLDWVGFICLMTSAFVLMFKLMSFKGPEQDDRYYFGWGLPVLCCALLARARVVNAVTVANNCVRKTACTLPTVLAYKDNAMKTKHPVCVLNIAL